MNLLCWVAPQHHRFCSKYCRRLGRDRALCQPAKCRYRLGTRRQPRKHETVFQRNYRTLPLWGVKYCPTRNNVGYRLYQGLGLDTRKSFQGSHLNRRCHAVQWINSRRVKNCMLCVICISRGGSASVSFSEVEERSVDLRNVSTVPSQSEPTRYVGRPTQHHGFY